MKTKQFLKKGQVLFREGSGSDFIFIVEQGEFEVSRKDSHGRVEILDTLGRNDMFGEMGVFEDRPRSATVRALKDGVVRVVTKEELIKTMQKNPSALMFILKTMANRVRSAADKKKKVLKGAMKFDLASDPA